MDLIVSHKNADFDALSSLVAAKKLYPRAKLLLPGSWEKAVRNFMALFKDEIMVENEKTCELAKVKRLIIVDNRHKSRIGVAADLVGKKGVKIHVYDHHPKTRYDIKADKDVFKEVGATVSIILEILLKKGKFDFTPLEATLMLLGIYEETGSLSYRATTKLDVEMVGKLLEQGANLTAVSSYLNRELENDELRALVELLGSVEVVNQDGLHVAFAGFDASNFSGETSTVVHKLQDVENYPVLFVMFRSGEKIKLLARSRVEQVNVNKLLSRFGGAGHSSAASTRFIGKTFDEVKKDVLEGISSMMRGEIYAKDIMSFPVWTVFQDEKVSVVMKKIKSLGYKGAPVVDSDGNIAGVITIGDLKKAITNNMGHSRIKGYMSTPLITVGPDTAMHVLKEIMTAKDKGRVPVMKEKKLVGIVTRNDVLKKVHKALFEKLPAASVRKKNMKILPIIKKMKALVPERLMQIINVIGSCADADGVNVFLVGGFVRDVILGKRNYDLDLVVEGDAIVFAEALKKKFGGTLVEHRKFGTATLVKKWPSWLGSSLHPDGKFKIDIAAARKEKYEKPAALPVVRVSSLKKDLYRRDFTINAMAIKINKIDFGLFADYFSGMRDLEKGIIRVLHDKSFLDDPTRIFRAVRFEQRFGFRIEQHTEYLIQHAVKQEMFQRTENQRIREELILMLKERDPEKAVYRMKQLHELRFIHPELSLKRSTKGMFSEVKKCLKWYRSKAARGRHLDAWIINFLVMIESLDLRQTEEVLEKFVFTGSVSMRIRSYKEKERLIRRRLSSSGKVSPSLVYRSLEPLSHEVTLCIMARTKSSIARRRIRKFLTTYNGVKLKIKGHDIKKEGVSPGPRYKEILRKVLYEKLDGKLSAKKDEIKCMRNIIAQSA